ncbi:bifunctional terpene synthase/polyprenyl synthetase family protein [Aspergillus saccharolyticus JOP 1030-1]|uniref:Geranylgeranyl pyrophosphate synthase n=1 Tax=Aspergillus saccharolyticus JOP 1030-1 TaxID=1450539 RepID=A0A318YZW5_9EURO|nr:geranylgeranyl pyrophosphate synthase [Aspergillus saccharolyticus JOP 1030-1]PYH40159.1 geranylgeranyl pyrophosphate synthase [Aspergillus saccharolyticus JOP 1030-1]
MECIASFPEEDQFSRLVARETPDLHGFCHGYPLRRHQWEHRANEGSLHLRADWEKYIGPIERWGSCNPWEGHFGAVVLPCCRPERMAIVNYIFEYAFMYDNVVESAANSTINAHADEIALDETEYRTVRSVTGTKQVQSKMLVELFAIDPACAQVVLDAWKTMIDTTATKDKTRAFSDWEEYVDYRIIDTGAPFVDMLMRFGMGVVLTPAEQASIETVVRPCYAALGLANDYFSFDVEWEEFQQSEETTMTNAVWLCMHWHGVDVPTAKEMVREVTNRFEREFQQRVAEYVAGEGQHNRKVQIYLRALGYQIPGNVAWSLRCPRYHPHLIQEAGKLLHDSMQAASDGPSAPVREQKRPSISEESESSESSVWSVANSPRSSISSASEPEPEVKLGSEYLRAPAEYIASLPSKGVREAFIDALNVWLMLPDRQVKLLKSIAKTLHNASLMLDDIEDASPLRRGQPATHTVYGIAQTINSANHLLLQAMDEVRQLEGSGCLDIYSEELRNLFIGQSWDLYWTRQGECPSEPEYMEMVRQKTGGLFRLLARLMLAQAPAQRNRDIPLSPLVTRLGEYFQIRDDYKNLTEEYTSQKGFCEDLDEGKFSFPLIHLLHAQPDNKHLREVLQLGSPRRTISIAQKQEVVGLLQRSGSMEYTGRTLRAIMGEIQRGMDRVELETGCVNWVLRFLVSKLEV